jgi:capsular polysaccharide transport system ATP-binding protein
MIRLRRVTKSYPTAAGRRYVLRRVDLDIPSGVNVAILGRNGAGKSTLLRLLGGIDHPEEGAIVTACRISWPVALTGGLQGSLSGRDNARFVCRIHDGSRAEVARRLAYVEAFAELGAYFDEPVRTYSSGMRSRLSFGLSMAFDFDYYLIDEVTAVGDPSFREKCRLAFEARRARSKFIMVSHNMKTLRQFCDVAVLLGDGRARLFDDLEAAIDVYNRG